MTDDHDPLDELASAHLDGQTTAAEAARVDADPALAARVARLAAVRAALAARTEVPADGAQRDRAIGIALAAFDAELAAEADPAAADPRVVTVHAARGWRSRRRLQLIGAAAAVVLVALTIPLLGRLDPDAGEEDLATTADTFESQPATGDAGGTSRAAQEMAADGGDAAALSTAAEISELGAFDDVESLADAVRSRLGDAPAGHDPATSTSAPVGPDEPCATQTAADGVRFRALATLAAREVVVIVRERTDELALEVLDRGDCSTVTTATL